MAKAAEDPKGETHYLDSMQNEKVWFGAYTLKQCREMEIGLGLDLNDRLQRELDRLWDNGTINETKMDEWRNTHYRTPYKQ